MKASGAASIEIAGQEFRVLETLTNLPAMRTWLCESSGRRIHLRMLSGSDANIVAERARKIREVASGSGLVVPLETGEQDGKVYALRAWVDADTFDVFAKRFKFSPKRQAHALNSGVKLCRAVESLHHAGLMHGALTNSNVYFEKDGSPIVTDPLLSEDGTKKSDPREDVRALGLLLCRLYSGKPELAINNYTLMMLVKAKVSRQLIRVLWQAIHEEPSMRFPDAATLGRALREVPLPEYQRTVQVRALPDNVGPSDGMPAWLRNAALFVGAVGLIAVISWFLSQGDVSTVVPPKQAVAVSSTPQASSDFWELPVPGAQPIRMRRLPAFEAMLGDDDEPNSSRRMVRVDQPFSIASTEVTYAQFAAFVAANGYRTIAETADGDLRRRVWVEENDRIRPRPGSNWRQPGFVQGENHPVTSVSWYDAKAFCDWLAQQSGQRVRLPSEAEWEFAARAGSSSKYWWGDDPAGAQGRENVMDLSVRSIFPSRKTASWDDGFAFTSPVGSFEANPFGLHDMFGNVWEWTANDWNGSMNPKVFRGAGFSNWPPNGAAYRYGHIATIASNLRGFRIVVDGGTASTASAAPASAVQPRVALAFYGHPRGDASSRLLATLAELQVKGTFFLVGKNSELSGNQPFLRELVSQRHEVANRTYSDPDVRRLTPQQIMTDLKRASEVLQQRTGQTPKLANAPYGIRSADFDAAAQQVGLRSVRFDIYAREYGRDVTRDRIIASVLPAIRDGAVVGLGAHGDPGITAVPEIVRQAQAKGFSLVTVSELLQGAKGLTGGPVAAVVTPPPAPESPCDPIPTGPLTQEELTRLVPDGSPGRVRVSWKTQAQQDVYGFNVFIGPRREGPWSQANVQIIPGYGTRDRVTNYCFQVPNLIRGQSYWVQVQELSSTGQTDVIVPPTEVRVKTIPEEREWLAKKAAGK